MTAQKEQAENKKEEGKNIFKKTGEEDVGLE